MSSTDDLSFRRFTIRLLREALFLGAETVVIEQRGSSLHWRALKSSRELRGASLTKEFAVAWLIWLQGHATPHLSEQGALTVGISFDEEILLCSLTVQSETNKLIQFELGSVRALPRAQVIEKLGVLPGIFPGFEALLRASQGVLLVSSPNKGELESLLGLFAAISLGRRVETIDWQTTQIHEDLLLLGVVADHPLAALQGIPSQGLREVIGALCCVALPRLCERCLDFQMIDRELSNRLPAKLRVMDAREGHSRGCTECRTTGVRGIGLVLSLLRLDNDLRGLSKSGVVLELVRGAAYDRAAYTLLEIGLQRVQAGAHRLMDLLQSVPTLSAGFEALVDARATLLQSGEPLRDSALRSTELRAGARSALGQVLLVEDDADQRQILSTVFRTHGFEVVEASDGVEGLSKLEESSPRIIVTDLMMPRVDGQDFVRRVRAQQKYAALPILVLTVIADQEMEYLLLELGADEYCAKSVQPRVLLKRMELLMRRYGDRI